MDGQKGDWPQALSDLDHSLAYNTLNCRAWDLKAAALRKLGRADEAKEAASKALPVDPLDLWGLHELDLLGGSGGAEIARGNSVQSYLELARDYAQAGLAGESEQVLKGLVATSPDANKVNPLVYYDLGYLAAQRHEAEEASQYYHLAAQMPPDYVFPFRLEEEKVLEAAIRTNPADARAPYYLGNLFYDRQPAAAIKMWEKSADVDGSFALVYRNLAQAYQQVENDTAKAITAMEKAVQLDQNDSRFLYELDTLYEAGNVPPQKRAASFRAHAAVAAQRSDALMQEAKVDLLLGQYDRSIQLLEAYHFHNWEGYGEIHDVYVDAHVLRGEREFKSGKYPEALKDYEASLEYPENLEVGRPYHEPRLPQVNYLLGLTYEKLGNRAKSRELFHQALAGEWRERRHGQPEMLYYQGMAALKLGQHSDAIQLFDQLIALGEKALAAGSEVDYFAKFGQRRSDRFRRADADYLIGLGNLGKGETAKAMAEFQAALGLNVNHLGATTQLAGTAGP